MSSKELEGFTYRQLMAEISRRKKAEREKLEEKIALLNKRKADLDKEIGECEFTDNNVVAVSAAKKPRSAQSSELYMPVELVSDYGCRFDHVIVPEKKPLLAQSSEVYMPVELVSDYGCRFDHIIRKKPHSDQFVPVKYIGPK